MIASPPPSALLPPPPLSLLCLLLALVWRSLPALGRGLQWLAWGIEFFVGGFFWEIWDRLRR